MTKAEIIEAINATIAPNNVKGITAESLANLLIEVVNAAGEGGGGVGSEYIDLTLADPDNIESIELTADAMVHNAELYKKILSIASSNEGAAFPVVSLGGSMLGPFVLYSKAIVFGEGYIDFIFPVSMDPTINDVVMVIGHSITTGTEGTAMIGSWGMDIPFRMTPDGNVAILLGL